MKNKSKYQIIRMGYKLIFIFSLSFLLISMNLDNKKIENEFISIEELIHKKKIDVLVNSLGGHNAYCVQFNLTNLTSDNIYVLLEPGRRLVSYKDKFQDILIVKEKKIKINPNSNKIIQGYGFCCQSNKASPEKNSEFNIGYMASENLIKLSNVINNNNFPPNAIQFAVWTISDNHSIGSIHYEDLNQILELRKAVAEILDIEVPWYSVTYENDTSMLFSNRPETISGELDFYINSNRIITINIRNKNGRVINTLIENRPYLKGEYTFNLNLSVKYWNSDEYTINIYEDSSKLIVSKKFKI